MSGMCESLALACTLRIYPCHVYLQSQGLHCNHVLCDHNSIEAMPLVWLIFYVLYMLCLVSGQHPLCILAAPPGHRDDSGGEPPAELPDPHGHRLEPEPPAERNLAASPTTPDLCLEEDTTSGSTSTSRSSEQDLNHVEGRASADIIPDNIENTASWCRPPAPEAQFPDHQRDRYNIEAHMETSANESGEVASGCDTPPPPIYLPDQLAQRVRRQLDDLWEQGCDVLVQMMAQELRRLALLRQNEPMGPVLAYIAHQGAAYIHPHFEVGIALPPRWHRWLQSIYVDAFHAARHSDANLNHAQPDARFVEGDSHDSEWREEDVASLVTTGPWRRTVDKRSTDRSRSRERSSTIRLTSGTGSRSSADDPCIGPPWRTPEPEAASPTTSTTRRLVPPREMSSHEVLSLNRHTWRNILGMCAGTGTDLTQILDRPLPEYCMENILATCSSMTSQERLSFLASFTRFILEAAQQVSEVIVLGQRQDATGGDDDPSDHLMLVQTGAVLRAARAQFQDLQQALEKSGGACHHRAQLLRSQLRRRHCGMPESEIPPDVHALQAMLLVYIAEGPQTAEVPTEEDISWANSWWDKLTPALMHLDTSHGVTSTCLEVEPEEVDTPPTALTDTEEHDLTVLEDIQRQDDEALIEDFDRYHREQQAARAQAEDDECLARAMLRGTRPTKRLHINITVTSRGTSSTASMDAAMPLEEPISITFSMQPREISAPADDPNEAPAPADDPNGASDQINLMQRMGRPVSISSESLLARIQRHMATVHPQLRSIILAALRQRLAHRLRQLLHQALDIQMVLQQEILGDQPCQNITSPAVSDLTEFVINQIDQNDHIPDAHLRELPDLLHAFQSLTATTSSTMDHDTAASSWEGPPLGTNAEDVRRVATTLRAAIMSKFVLLEGDREQSRREFVKSLIATMQLQGAKLHVLLLLLPDFLPQPNQVECAARHVQTGGDILRALMRDLDEAVTTECAQNFGQEPFGLCEAVFTLAPLSSLAVEVMTFLESGGDVFASESGDDTEEHMQVEALEMTCVLDAGTGSLATGVEETQTTHLPTSHAAGGLGSSSSSTPTGQRLPPEPGLEDEDHALLHLRPGLHQRGSGITSMTGSTRANKGSTRARAGSLRTLRSTNGASGVASTNATKVRKLKGKDREQSPSRMVQQGIGKYAVKK